jgi:hypothetical protein
VTKLTGLVDLVSIDADKAYGRGLQPGEIEHPTFSLIRSVDHPLPHAPFISFYFRGVSFLRLHVTKV